jgi:hypothetical protein
MKKKGFRSLVSRYEKKKKVRRAKESKVKKVTCDQ